MLALIALCIIQLIITVIIAVQLRAKEKSFAASEQRIQQSVEQQQERQREQREHHEQHMWKILESVQKTLGSNIHDLRDQLFKTLQHQTTSLESKVHRLTEHTEKKLHDIHNQVDIRLSDGFKKTNATFLNVIERLSVIDQAQKEINKLSSNVMSLQEILSDKRSRGAFGEVQLNGLIRNMLPEKNFSLQHTLSNHTRVDCLLYLPAPTGNIAIDAKFPMENYQRWTNIDSDPATREKAHRQFKQDIKKHISDIASKYILPGETAEGAMLFLPAEAIFADIHAHLPEIVAYSQQQRVWLVSPTTMMAILTTARAVLKDAETRKQVHIIQEHLVGLSDDFKRFRLRMDKLAKHIAQAQQDVEDVHTSSRKIANRFAKIEQVELQQPAEIE